MARFCRVHRVICCKLIACRLRHFLIPALAQMNLWLSSSALRVIIWFIAFLKISLAAPSLGLFCQMVMNSVSTRLNGIVATQTTICVLRLLGRLWPYSAKRTAQPGRDSFPRSLISFARFHIEFVHGGGLTQICYVTPLFRITTPPAYRIVS